MLIADKLKRELNISLAIVELRNEFIIQISVSYGCRLYNGIMYNEHV